MRILILGADGQLGRELTGGLGHLGDLVAATRDGRPSAGEVARAINLERPDEMRAAIRDLEPEVIVNAAAYTQVDRAETEADRAHRVNAEAPAVLAEEALRLGALLVHFSTDYVFGGETKRAWQESDPTVPVNVYGRTKLAGEEAIRISGCRHLILRTSWLYAAHGRNFLLRILQLAAERHELRVVDDQFGSPTWARSVASATAAMLESVGPSSSGPRDSDRRDGDWTYHVAASGETTWFGFAEAALRDAVDVGLLERLPRLRAIPTREYPTPAGRPSRSTLDCGRLERVFAVRLPEWRVALAQCVTELAGARRGTA